MKHPIKHVRHHARKHHKAHLTLKELLEKPLYREKILELFLGTFAAALLTIVIFMNWGRIVQLFQKPEPPVIVTEGSRMGVEGAYEISRQRTREHNEFLARIPTQGYQLGMQGNQSLGAGEPQQIPGRAQALQASVFVTNELSLGRHLSGLRQAKGLQKSVLSTFYLGEKTVTVDDTLALDTRLLGQIRNALEVDLFQYLNQAANRSNQLSGYLNLLNALRAEAVERANELNAKIAFLEQSTEVIEERLSFTEEQFFNQLQMFGGASPVDELKEFIGLQSEQSEARAKLGAYAALRDYYQYFLPQLETRILAVNANWDALIAGVRVTEIEGMNLPLIVEP